MALMKVEKRAVLMVAALMDEKRVSMKVEKRVALVVVLMIEMTE